MAGPIGVGGIRYWAVQSGRVGVEGGGIKEACLVVDRLLCMFCLSRFSFIVFRRGFQGVLRTRLSSLFILFGCICISIASLMRWSEYPILAERSFLSLSSHHSHFILHIEPLKMDLTEGSEMSAKLNLTLGKYPKEHIQDSEHGENLKSRRERRLTKKITMWHHDFTRRCQSADWCRRVPARGI
jgi:hypothetical protein